MNHVSIPLADTEVTDQKVNAKEVPRTLHYVGDGIAILQIDNSSLTDHCQCPRKYEYGHIRKRQRQNSFALTYGSAIHEALEYYYTCYALKEDLDLDEMLRKGLKCFEGKEVGLNNWRTPELFVATMKSYISHWQHIDDFKILQLEDGPGIERKFSLPLGEIQFDAHIPCKLFSNPKAILEERESGMSAGEGPTTHIEKVQIYWIGKIDLLIEIKSQLFTSDHKTTSKLGSTFWGQFGTSRQMQGYCWAANEMLEERPLGTMINCVAGRKPTKTGKGTEFVRQRFFYDEETLDEWKQNTLELCSDLLFNFRRAYFPMNTDQCQHKYGACQYLDCCSLPPEQREMFLQTDHYTDNTWSPLDES